jgi:hypothetical protein
MYFPLLKVRLSAVAGVHTGSKAQLEDYFFVISSATSFSGLKASNDLSLMRTAPSSAGLPVPVGMLLSLGF